jgi:hypothetical protein
MNSDQTLKSVSEKAHAEYGQRSEVGMHYFASTSQALALIEPSHIVAYQMRHFCLRYVLDFLLSSPSIWKEMGISDWIRTFRLSSPRPSFDKVPDDTGWYADLIFLYKFVKVDGIRLLLDDPDISMEDKSRVARYCHAHAPLFFADDLDEEDLDGCYFVSIEKISRYREKLHCGGFELAESNPDVLLKTMEHAMVAYPAH